MTRAVRADRICTPRWQRLAAETRARIEAAVPEGEWLTITIGRPAMPGTMTVRRIALDELDYPRTVAEARGRGLSSLCWAVLPRVTVTVGADGFVTAIEEDVA